MGQPPRIPRGPRVPAALILLASLALGASPAVAAVFINEVYPNLVGSETGSEEKVEIYNAGPSAVDMTGWGIDDAVTISTSAVRARIPEDLDPACSTNPIIQPGE